MFKHDRLFGHAGAVLISNINPKQLFKFRSRTACWVQETENKGPNLAGKNSKILPLRKPW